MNDEIVKVADVDLSAASGEGEVIILKGINLAIEEGEFVSVMGPSGAGKSSLMYVMGGMLTPKSGCVVVDGIDVYSLDHEKRAEFRMMYLGFVFQTFHLFPYLTVIENVMVPMVNSGWSAEEKRQRARGVLGEVGLGDKEGRFPSQLSGGECQRVAIARALVNDPLLIFADEPTGNLDSRNGMAILELFSQLNSKGKTIIVITHSEEYAKRSHRVLYLKDGSLNGSKINNLPAE